MKSKPARASADAPRTPAAAPRASAASLLVPFVCFFLSGASSLIFEVIWTRKFTLVFGASTLAITTVLTTFMGGLALGSWLLGRWADRLKFPILTYAALETGVGLFALLVPVVVDHAYPPVSRLITNHGGNSFSMFTLLRFVAVAVVLLPPTTLMGATLPLLTRHFVRQQGGLGQRVGALYATNTFGAVAGTFSAGLVLLPTIGLWQTNLVAGLMNLTLAALIVGFRRELLGASWPASARDLLPTRETQALDYAFDAGPARTTSRVAIAVVCAVWLGLRVALWLRHGVGISLLDYLFVGVVVVLGAVFYAWQWRARRAEAQGLEPVDDASEDDLIEEPRSRAVRYATLAAAGGSGFAALAYEVILSRALDMVIGSSIYSFVLILMAFLVGIGGGSALASAILRARPGPVACAVTGGAFLTVALAQMLISGTRISLMIFVVTALVVMLCLLIAATWRRPTLALGAVQLMIGIGAACTYYFQDKIPRMFVYLAMVVTDSCDPSRPLAFSHHVPAIQMASFATAVLCALPPTLGMGASFPLAVRAFARNVDHVGADTGAVYSVNTIGSIVGSFLTGFILLPLVGMETAFYIAVSVNLVMALGLMLVSPGEEPAKYVLVPIVSILLAIAGTGAIKGREWRATHAVGRLSMFPHPWNQELMTMGVFRLSLADGMIQRRNNQCLENEDSDREQGLSDDNPIYYRDGVTTTVTVERWTLGDHTHYALKNNGKVDASNGDDMPTQVLVSALPLLTHRGGPDNLDVAIVGWGSGVTVGTTLRFPVRHVDVIELERSTIDASRFFTEVNHLDYNLPDFPYVSMPRLRIQNNDGRNYLGGTDHHYDVIISEPSNPWITGVSNLFTLDHFTAASRALAPHGIFLQWVQLYELSPNNIKTIYRTIAEVFPYVRVFAADAYSSDTIVLGSFSPIELDLARTDAFLASHPDVRAALAPSHAQSAPELFSRMIFGTRDEVRRFAVLDQRLEHGEWQPDLRGNGGLPCAPGSCRRTPAPINTDDNALIEFAAPRDLIGFDAFAGYTETLYTDDWPYGRVENELTGTGEGASRVNALSRLGVALLAAGRPSRAGEVIEQAAALAGPVGSPNRTPELERSAGIWTAMTSAGEPTLRLEALQPGPEITREGERRLEESWTQATRLVRQRQWSTALAAFASIPANVRESSGPSLRMLYGYLLYKASLADDAEPHFTEAADTLERLAHDEPEWATRHPEVMFYIGRSRFRAGDFALSVAALGSWVDLMRVPSVHEHELPDVARDFDEPALDQAPVTDGPGEANKDHHAS